MRAKGLTWVPGQPTVKWVDAHLTERLRSSKPSRGDHPMVLATSSRPPTFDPQIHARKRILVIEDERKDLDHFSSVFREHRFDVFACASAAQGATLLEKDKYDFILVEQG